MSMEDRVGKVEDGLSRLSSEVRVQGHDLGALKGDVAKIGEGVGRLLERDAKRPEALTLKAIAAVCAATVTIAVVGHWLIAQAPAVQDMSRRLDKLDDPDIGRVTRVERHLDTTSAGWSATVRRQSR